MNDIIITKEDMLAAQKDNNKAYEIIEKMKPVVLYSSNIVYYYYGARHDHSLSIEDIVSFMNISLYQAIGSYNPDKYDKSKDKTGNKIYMDGFRYLSSILKRLIKYYHRYHHMKKRIPPEYIHSLGAAPGNKNATEVDETHIEGYEYNPENDENTGVETDFHLILSRNIRRFDELYIQEINVKKVIEMLFNGSSIEDISQKLNIKKETLRKVVNLAIDEDAFPFLDNNS